MNVSMLHIIPSVEYICQMHTQGQIEACMKKAMALGPTQGGHATCRA
jgi:hypothetical protein